MFRFENATTKDGTVIWTNKRHGSASTCRPVMLLLGKESYDNCGIVKILQKERNSHNFTVTLNKKQTNVFFDAEMTMVDGKLHSLLTGLGGAFCCLCSYSKEQCNTLDYVKAGFPVDRSLEQTKQICEEKWHLLENRKPNDYKVRQGVTKEPITNEEHLTLHPLHSYLRVFGWIYKICYHAVAGHFNWSESKFEGISKSQGVNNLIESKRKIQKCVEEEINVALEKPDPTGHGGTSTTGNVVKTLLNTNNRTLLTKHISDVSLKENIDKIILYVSIILCLINSNRQINVEKYSVLCQKTMMLVMSVKWIRFTPTAHTVLAHSAELIEQNNGRGLLNYTESGLEANNKFLRQYRMNFSRKTSQYENLTDCLNRLWDKSDYDVNNTLDRLNCTYCKEVGHTARSCLQLNEKISSCSSEWETLLYMICATE